MSELLIERVAHLCGFDAVSSIDLVRSKAGVHVYRAVADGTPVVIKHLVDEGFRREVENYRLLQRLGVPTVRTYGLDIDLVVMADVTSGDDWRLGEPEDLDDQDVAAALADWYSTLHERGVGIPELDAMYREWEALTPAALHLVGQRWPDLAEHIARIDADALRAEVAGLPETLTYNDFYWTNMAVAPDGTAALMFDYNLCGAGYRYGDLRNVTSSLSPRAGRAFLAAYRGEVDDRERRLDPVAGHLYTLIAALEAPALPIWAEESAAFVRRL